MYKARHYLNTSTLVSLYYSYVYPYLTYCIEVWDVLIQPISTACSHRAIIYGFGNLAIRKDILPYMRFNGV